jgi:hypothetical protein
MASPQRQARIYAIREHMVSHIAMLKEELNIFFDNPVGVVSDQSYFDHIEDKVVELAEYQGALDALDTHFKEDK